jgi:hypothetical protein
MIGEKMGLKANFTNGGDSGNWKKINKMKPEGGDGSGGGKAKSLSDGGGGDNSGGGFLARINRILGEASGGRVANGGGGNDPDTNDSKVTTGRIF